MDFKLGCAIQKSYIQGSNVSAEWVLLYTKYEKHTSTDNTGETFNEMHFMHGLQFFIYL